MPERQRDGRLNGRKVSGQLLRRQRADERAAQIDALTAVAPILPPELYVTARKLTKELNYPLDNKVGSRFAVPLAMRGATWYHALPDDPLP